METTEHNDESIYNLTETIEYAARCLRYQNGILLHQAATFLLDAIDTLRPWLVELDAKRRADDAREADDAQREEIANFFHGGN